MDLVIFAMLGGSIGWGLSRMACTRDGRVAPTINILAGVCGAVAAGWFLIPFLGAGARNDFTVTASVVSLGAVVVLTVAAFLRQFRRVTARRSFGHRRKVRLAAPLSRALLHTSRHGP